MLFFFTLLRAVSILKENVVSIGKKKPLLGPLWAQVYGRFFSGASKNNSKPESKARPNF